MHAQQLVLPQTATVPIIWDHVPVKDSTAEKLPPSPGKQAQPTPCSSGSAPVAALHQHVHVFVADVPMREVEGAQARDAGEGPQDCAGVARGGDARQGE